MDETPTPSPDAAVQIALGAVRDVDEAHAAVAALARAGWLHDPAEVAALRAVADATRVEVQRCEASDAVSDAVRALDAPTRDRRGEMMEPEDMMPIDEAVEVLRAVTCRPAVGVVWSRQELAERSALARLAALEAEVAALQAVRESLDDWMNHGLDPDSAIAQTWQAVNELPPAAPSQPEGETP